MNAPLDVDDGVVFWSDPTTSPAGEVMGTESCAVMVAVPPGVSFAARTAAPGHTNTILAIPAEKESLESFQLPSSWYQTLVFEFSPAISGH